MDYQTTIKEIMSKDLITVRESDPLDKFKNHFSRRGIHHILVEDENQALAGIISTEDMNRVYRFALINDKVTAEHIMTKNPTTLKEDMPILDAVNLFLMHQYRALPVLDKTGALTGIVTTYDLMKEILNAYYLEKELEDEEDLV